MITLRERTREALEDGALAKPEVDADFARIAARTRWPRRAWVALGALGTAVAAAAAYLLVARASVTTPGTTEIYIRIEGEPAGDALALTLVNRPDAQGMLVVTPEGIRP